ncbi:hypothetical protein L484_018898 [Morus notabilis]|uniref:Pentatricopeptide repeat-containing protein n=1 Tax=Morus notabilis TaxID=981085 RepID=W9REH5_9ROSA|nr:hypothetical protein L484_018898 [Morus notabilis]
MTACGVIPNKNEITFLTVRGAFLTWALGNEGRRHFDSMIREHEIVPNVKNCECMVDLLGCADMLKKNMNSSRVCLWHRRRLIWGFNWDDVLEIKGTMVQMEKSMSFLQETRHPLIIKIRETLNQLAVRLKMEGYAPVTNEIFLAIDKEEKENALLRRSLKLAWSLGFQHKSSNSNKHNEESEKKCHNIANFISKDIIERLWRRISITLIT